MYHRVNNGGASLQVKTNGIAPASSHFNLPDQVLVGYWFEWTSSSLEYFGHTRPEEVPAEYNVIIVAFMTSPEEQCHLAPTFSPDPDFLGEQGFKDGVNLWKNQGREVLISLGGAAGCTQVTLGQKEAFKNELRRVVNEYGFTGVDINLENNSINAADNEIVIPQVLNELKAEFNSQGRKFLITMAPEFPYLRPDMPVGDRTYGAYLATTNYDLIMPQYYNQAGDGVNIPQTPWWVTNGNESQREDFTYYLTQALINGTDGHIRYFQIPADKIAIGFPSTVNAAYGQGIFYTDPNIIAAAITRLRQAGSNIRGVMTWSIPQDKMDYGRGSFDFGHRMGAFLGLPSGDGGGTLPGPTTPLVPTGLQSSNVGTHAATISWQAATHATGYAVYRNGTRITPNPLTNTSFTDSGLTPDTTFNFQIRALGQGGTFSTLSEGLSVHTTSEYIPTPQGGGNEELNSPTNLRITGQTSNSISFAWNASGNTSSMSYEIYRDNIKIDTVSSQTLTYTDYGLIPNTQHQYTVRAHTASDHSNSATGITSQNGGGTPPSPNEYPEWNPNSVQYSVGDIVRHQGQLFRCINPHVSNAAWAPDVAFTLWQSL